jgi:hypothetical protein
MIGDTLSQKENVCAFVIPLAASVPIFSSGVSVSVTQAIERLDVGALCVGDYWSIMGR